MHHKKTSAFLRWQYTKDNPCMFRRRTAPTSFVQFRRTCAHTLQTPASPCPYVWFAFEDRMMPTIRPYSARASAKIKIKIIPTNNLGCWAFALTPASPTIPIAIPAANPDKPHANPAAKCAYPAKSGRLQHGREFSKRSRTVVVSNPSSWTYLSSFYTRFPDLL